MNEFVCEDCANKAGLATWLTYVQMKDHKAANPTHKIIDINKEALSEEVDK